MADHPSVRKSDGGKNMSARQLHPRPQSKAGRQTSPEPPHADDPVWLEIQDYLTVRLNMLYRLLDRQTKQILGKKYGLSAAEWRTLAFLAGHGRSTVREIASRRYMAKSQISRAAAALEKQGLVDRRDDPENARSVILEITPKGRSTFLRILPTMRDRHQKLQTQITDEERHVFDAVIARLTDYLRPN